MDEIAVLRRLIQTDAQNADLLCVFGNLRRRHENRADKWAIKTLIPVDALDDAIASGCTQLWELAERFGVTEEFIKKAVCYHVRGNLATELYF